MSDLKRYFIQQDLSKGLTALIGGAQYNHLVNVIRQKKGDKIILLNGDGYDYTAEIIEISKQNATVLILDKQENLRKTKINLTVFCGLLKGDTSENQAVKLSELGIYEFVPFISENCVIKKDSKKAERLNRVASESSKQCKRAIPIKVSDIKSYSEILNNLKNYQIKIIAYEQEKNNTLKQALKGIEICKNAALIIGPEGGFSKAEVDMAINAGCNVVTLGKTILKADTAAISAAAAILYEAGEWSR